MKRFASGRHRWCRGVVIGFAALSTALTPVSAFAQGHDGGRVAVQQNADGGFTIGNEYLARTFSVENDKWSTSSIVNKRIDETFIPGAGSENFVINLIDRDYTGPTVQVPTQIIQDRSAWKATLSNMSGAVFEQTHKLFDGNLDTYVDEWQKAGTPISLVIDLGDIQEVGSFSVDKRPGYQDPAYGKNGTMGRYSLFVSEDGLKWNAAGSGEFKAEDYRLHDSEDGSLHNVGDRVYGNFDKVYRTRYIKIVQKSDCLGGTGEFSSAEINVFSDQKQVVGNPDDTDIRTSELTIAENGVTIDDDTNSLRVEFEPIEIQGATWQIAEVTAMEDGAHYMNSHLEIKSGQPDAVAIDYIDTDRFVLPKDAKDVWSIPEESKITSMWIGAHELMLGQPIYVDGLFMGSEFPVEETDVIDESSTTKIRYYSGKTLKKMADDEQDTITSEDGSVTFRTWSNVVGAAKGTATDVVQTDFFAYIEDVATPSTFRKQYNSWYDNMMNITPESVERSFMGSEKGLAQNGVEPLDSYVVDDGWNNYNNEVGNVNAPGESGTTMNRTGFWEFNSKWPNELYDSTNLAHNLQSTFGVWVGPQGGYNFFGGFAEYLQSQGTGFVSNDYWKHVCVGSRTYIDNFEKRFLDYQNRFDIDYWKWDGFAVRPCTSTDHNHMTGGDRNMYYTSDMWEAWTDLIEEFRSARAQDDKGLWINATCYVNPSPWLLQWVNSVWVQDSGDTGEAGDQQAARHQRKIYYRDNVYYNLYKKNQIQFPLKNIYNHDPIYGVSDGSSATTEVFREFLIDNAMRGTAFWELYYSPSIMDDAKWQVTADVLDFAETNHEILKNAKLFVAEGANPTNGVYGYSAWNGDQGIVSFVNPTATEQTYTLPLTDVYGVPQGVEGLVETQVYPYAASSSSEKVSYGDELTVTLAPFSSQVLQFGDGNESAPELVSAKIIDDETIRVAFDTRMSDAASFKVGGVQVEAQLLDDYRTFELKGLDFGRSAELQIADAAGVFGSAAGDSVQGTLKIDTAGVVARLKKASDAVTGVVEEFENDASGAPMLGIHGSSVAISGEGVTGTADFSVQLVARTTAKGATLVAQGSDWSVALDADGYAVFTVGDQAITSKHEVSRVVGLASGTFGTPAYQKENVETTVEGVISDGSNHSIIAVRELNGMIKLYIDGELVSSAYADGTKTDLVGGKVTVGDVSFAGYVSDVEVRNAARYYDEASQHAIDHAIGDDTQELPRDGWGAVACSEQTAVPGTGSDGAAVDVLDGNPSTYWHSNYSGQDTCDTLHALTIDFGKTLTFDNLHYIGRPTAGNGDWQQVKIIGIDADGTEHVIRDMSEVAMDNGREAVFAFEAPQTFARVRFEIQGKGGYGSAGEVFASKNIVPVDTSAVEALRAEALKARAGYPVDSYTAASYKVLSRVIDKVLALNPFNADDAAKVDAYRDELLAAIEGLVKVEEVSFIDVVAETPHKGDIEWLAANGISTGWENADGTFSFRPYETVRRADMAAFLYRLAGEPELDADEAPAFADVDESTPHRDAILWLASEGISTGFEGADGKAEFRPYDQIARCDMAAFLYRMAGEPKFETDKGFADVAKDTPHREAVLWLAETGVSEGWELEDGTTEFRPYDQIARADMAAFVHRMDQKDLVK